MQEEEAMRAVVAPSTNDERSGNGWVPRYLRGRLRGSGIRGPRRDSGTRVGFDHAVPEIQVP